MQAVKIVLPEYFLAKFDTSCVSRGGVNGSLNLQRLRNRGPFVYRIKPPRHVENVIINFALTQ